MINQNKLFAGVMILFSLCLVLLVYITYKISTEGAQCTLDPYTYGAQKLQETNDNYVSCSCSATDSLGYLYFDANGSQVVEGER